MSSPCRSPIVTSWSCPLSDGWCSMMRRPAKWLRLIRVMNGSAMRLRKGRPGRKRTWPGCSVRQESTPYNCEPTNPTQPNSRDSLKPVNGGECTDDQHQPELYDARSERSAGYQTSPGDPEHLGMDTLGGGCAGGGSAARPGLALLAKTTVARAHLTGGTASHPRPAQ